MGREYKLTEIKLTEAGEISNRVQVLRVGRFHHSRYGDFEITRAMLAEMKTNFDAKVRGIDVAFDFFHESEKEASGWPTVLELTEDGTELWATVDWTPKARRMLMEREVRYFSPDFGFKWVHPETGQTFNNVLFGGGLTNRPFVKEMAAITAAEEREYMNELEKLKKELADANAALEAAKAEGVKLSEAACASKKLGDDSAAKAKALEDQIAALQAELAKLKGEKEIMLSEKKAAEEKAAVAAKESEFTVLLSEGKACAAQKDAFMAGDMAAFVKNAQPVNLKGAGSGGDAPDTTSREARVLKLAEEKRKADGKLSVADSISAANREINE